MKVLSGILAALAIAYFMFGMMSASSAPQQAVVVGACCFIGILARLAQASGQHDDKK